ncbi:MAG: cysteine--tRNA ligase [Bacteroidota bacterium]
MNTLHLYNTLSKKLEPFEPITPKHVGIYVCGPTVYGPPHLGHVRGPIVFDVLRKYLILQGNKVRYVRNITDVGHLVGDADEGEDKLAKQAKVEQLEPMEVAQAYTDAYNWVMDQVNVMKPSIEPRATGHIIEQIEMIQTIIDKGLAYEVNGSVYFDVTAYSEQQHYGQLSGRVLEDLQAGAGNQSRSLEGQDEKRSANDFALWKNATAEHIMQWSSPWGKGFPGWHIECSAMSARYLGDHFDIHGGGMDLLFPHHECEIAQSTAAHNQAPAKYWVHHNMITINGQKMAKSLGNGIMVEQLFKGDHPLLAQAFGPMTLRFFVLQAHYRGTLDFSNDALLAAQKGWQRMQTAFKLLNNLPTVNEGATIEADDLLAAVVSSLNDDLNTPQVIASLFELARRINLVNDGKESMTESTKATMKTLVADYCQGVLGLVSEDAVEGNGLADAMDIILALRGQAKADKNWGLSDQIRDALKLKGFEIKDGKDGTTWNKL